MWQRTISQTLVFASWKLCCVVIGSRVGWRLGSSESFPVLIKYTLEFCTKYLSHTWIDTIFTQCVFWNAFVLDRCQGRIAALTTIKYERDLKRITWNWVISYLSMTEKSNGALVTPTQDVSADMNNNGEIRLVMVHFNILTHLLTSTYQNQHRTVINSPPTHLAHNAIITPLLRRDVVLTLSYFVSLCRGVCITRSPTGADCGILLSNLHRIVSHTFRS